MDMSLLDPSQFCLPAIANYYLDPILQQAAANVRNSSVSAGGKMPSSLSSSFRICDLLEISSNTQCSNQSDPSPNSLQSESSISVSPGAISPNTERSGSPGSSGSKKSRKARTIFTDKQLQELENTFDKQKYLSVQDRMELAHRMGLSDTQVKTWYQNRRTKWKRQATTGIDLLSEPGNLAAVQHLIRNNTYWNNYIPNLPNLPMSQLVPMGMSLPMMIPPNQTFSVPNTMIPFTSPTLPETSTSSSKNSPPPFNPSSPSSSS